MSCSPSTSHHAFTKLVVIVVEDDDGLRQAMHRMLATAGFDARSYASSEALLKAEAAPSPACFVLDVRLAGVSGVQLLRSLRAQGIRTPVILISAYDDPRGAGHGTDIDSAAFLAKPFLGHALVEAVEQAIANGPARAW